MPTGISVFSMLRISCASRLASGAPRRRMPTSARFWTPLFFSTISCASRISVRSISEADMSCAFSRNFAGRGLAWLAIRDDSLNQFKK